MEQYNQGDEVIVQFTEQNSKLLLYVNKNNDYNTINIDDWINVSKKPLTGNDIERMKMGFWVLEHQENIEKVLVD